MDTMTGPLRKHHIEIRGASENLPTPFILPERSGTDPLNVALSVWYEYHDWIDIQTVIVDDESFSVDEIRKFDAN